MTTKTWSVLPISVYEPSCIVELQLFLFSSKLTRCVTVKSRSHFSGNGSREGTRMNHWKNLRIQRGTLNVKNILTSFVARLRPASRMHPVRYFTFVAPGWTRHDMKNPNVLRHRSVTASSAQLTFCKNWCYFLARYGYRSGTASSRKRERCFAVRWNR